VESHFITKGLKVGIVIETDFRNNKYKTRTPLLIGYSLSDPDFRQLWEILKERLGDLRRKAYTILFNPSRYDIARYERRGVKVIEI